MSELTDVLACPSCGQTTKQHRAGTNPSGTARRECRHCGRTYTPTPKPHGYDLALRRTALKMYVDGINFRRIARHLSVNHQSVINSPERHQLGQRRRCQSACTALPVGAPEQESRRGAGTR